MRTKWLVIGIGVLGIVMVSLIFMLPRAVVAPEPIVTQITNFEECKNAGYPVMESYPEQCRAPSGELFVQVIDETITKPTQMDTNFGTQVTLNINDTISFPDGLTVTLKEINDSRCKPDVQCIWAGELSALLSITGGKFGTNVNDVRLGTVNDTERLENQYLFALTNALETEVTVRVLKEAPINDTNTGMGYVSGHVTIGPICPVERIDNPCVVPPEVYTSRNVVVYAPDKITVKKKVALDTEGNYAIGLTPGTYWIQIQPAGIGEGEKKKVTIVSPETQTVDFDIDTGIR